MRCTRSLAALQDAPLVCWLAACASSAHPIALMMAALPRRVGSSRQLGCCAALRDVGRFVVVCLNESLSAERQRTVSRGTLLLLPLLLRAWLCTWCSHSLAKRCARMLAMCKHALCIVCVCWPCVSMHFALNNKRTAG